ncbi:MAG: SUMF1/EgtB/PvdO family nonheme iron enzyme [Myxococcota bacterium]
MRWLFRAGVVGAAMGVASPACLVEIQDLRSATGSTGSEGTGGAPSTASTSSAAGNGGNPTGAAGGAPCPPDMIHVTDPVVNPLANYCIDAYETTVAEHDVFLQELANGTTTAEQPSPACDGNVTFRQTGFACPENFTGPDRAVNCVDWCDAYAYCAYRGKRLCGAIGAGGPVVKPGDPYPGTQSDEWEFACSEGGRRAVPYRPDGGGPGVNDICACYFPGHWEPCANGADCDQCSGPAPGNPNEPGPARGYPDCEGGYPGLFNMVGNIMEWTNRCDGDGPDAKCMIRGGTVGDNDLYTYDVCDQKERRQARIDDFDDENPEPMGHWRSVQGIRCCKDAE